MLPEIEKLLIVQNHDQKILALEKELAGIPLEEEDIRERAETDEKAMNEAKLAVQENEVAIKNLELDIDTRKDSIAKLKIQQFETKKNDEFQKMGSEIERYGEEITGLEDQEIELMEKAEILGATYKAAREKFAESDKDVKEEIEDLHELKKNLEVNVAEEQKTRNEKSAALDEDLVYGYERLFKAKAGMAIVGLVDEVCQGCHMRVTKSTVVGVKGEKEVQHCENCGRILYWWTDDSVGKDMGEY